MRFPVSSSGSPFMPAARSRHRPDAADAAQDADGPANPVATGAPPLPAKLSVDLSKTGNVATANAPATLSVAQVGGVTHAVVLGNVSPRAADSHRIDAVKKRVGGMVGDKVHVSAEKLVRMDDVCANVERRNAGDKGWDEDRVTAAMASLIKDSVTRCPCRRRRRVPSLTRTPTCSSTRCRARLHGSSRW